MSLFNKNSTIAAINEDSAISFVPNLTFAIKYQEGKTQSKSSLLVKIVKAQNLPIMNTVSKSSDPFVIVQLLPTSKFKGCTNQTDVRHKNLKPWWNTTLPFTGLNKIDISNCTVLMQIYDWERFGRNSPIGQVMQHLNVSDILGGQEITVALEDIGQRGDLCFTMKYLEDKETYQLLLHKARNLFPMDLGGSSDPYVKMTMYQNSKKVLKHKSNIYKQTLDPVFKEKPFLFPCKKEDTANTRFDVEIMDYDKFSSEDLIGTVECI